MQRQAAVYYNWASRQQGFLLAVSLIPFSTGLLAGFITYRLAVLVYWLNILWLGAVLWGSWRYATQAQLLKPDTPAAMHEANAPRPMA